MMKKENKTFYFSVEGETEELYFKHLENLINKCLDTLEADFTNSLKAQKNNPKDYIKRITAFRQELVHVCDHEGNEDSFKATIDQMQIAKQKNVVYKLAYSNISFELWIILHKQDCNGCLLNVNAYLDGINKAFSLKYQNIGKYKSKKGFNRLLAKISLEDVYRAIEKAKVIQKQRMLTSKEENYRSYRWFKDNPALSLHLYIDNIFSFCLKCINETRRYINKDRKKKGLEILPDLKSLI